MRILKAYVTDKRLEVVDKGKYSVAVFLDLTKVFDITNHKILLSKLSYYGFLETSLDLCNYLSIGSKEFCLMESYLIGSIGVSQGSITVFYCLLCI